MNFEQLAGWHSTLNGMEKLTKEMEKNSTMSEYYKALTELMKDKNFDVKLFKKAYSLAVHNYDYSYGEIKGSPDKIYEYFYTPLTLQNSFCVVDYFEDNFVIGTNRNKCILFSKEDCELVIESLKHKGYKLLPIKVHVTAEKKLYRTLGTGLHLIKDDEGEFQCIKIIAKDHSVTYFNYTWGCIMQDTQKTFFDKYQVYQVSDISPKYNQKQF